MNQDNKNDVRDMMTSKEVMATFGISYSTLYRWKKSGRISFVEYPIHTYKYFREEIEKIIQKGF